MTLVADVRSARAFPVTLRGVGALSLLAAAAAHVPVAPEHLREAPYMGVAFIGFSVIATLLAVLVAAAGSRIGYALAAGLCGAAIGMYALTRIVALPQLADDVGNWTEPLGVVSVATELVALIASAAALAVHRRNAAGHGGRSGI